MIEQERLLANPFPGLRPFRLEENYVFFGRDGQSDQVLSKLGAARFVAVVGASGSGKSSLVSAGLLPALFSGHMPKAGSSWRVASFRPGSSPITNLAKALSAPQVSGLDPSEVEERSESIERTLRRSSLGLLEVVSQTKLAPGENILILADQFEELFRFGKKSTAERPADEQAAFVKLLLEAKQIDTKPEDRLPIYLILTMRSEYLSDCAHFWGLPEAINEGQFLIPRMTDDDRREAISGPVIIGGGEITATLVNRLLNDAGDDPAQLPILQHALMRTWDYWKNQCHAQGPIDIPHYEKIGTMKQALSEHADEAFLELPRALQDVAARVFKALTEKEPDNREGRRPATINEIATGSGASENQVVTVVEKFRSEGRSFLMPGPPDELVSDSLIDISHESLIRGWDRLRIWVDEEAEAARQYVRLADKAALFPQEEDYLRDPALSTGLKWLEDNQPTKAWAMRYHPGFAKTIEYLAVSQKQRQTEIDEREARHRAQVETDLRHAQALAAGEQQRVKLRNWGLLVLLLLLLGMTAVTVVAVQQTRVARQKTLEVNLQKVSLERALKDVEIQRDNAKRAEGEANRQTVVAKDALKTAREKTEKALIAEKETARQRDLAEQQRAKAVAQEAIAKDAKAKAEHQGQLLEVSLAEEKNARLEAVRSTAAALAAKEEAIAARRDAEATLNIVHEIDRAAPYFNAVIRGHNSPVMNAWLGDKEDVLFTQASDGSAQMWNTVVAAPDLVNQPYLADNLTKPAMYSRDGKLALLNNYQGQAGVILWDIPGRKQLFALPWTEATFENTIMSPDGQTILHYEKKSNHVSIYDHRTGRETQFETSAAYKLPFTVFSADGSLLGNLSASNSAATVWDVTTRKPVSELVGHLDQINSLAFSHDNKFVVTSSKDGTARVWDTRNGNPLLTLSGHAGPVNSAVFSDDAKYIVTTSGNLAYLWEAKSPASWTEVTEVSPTKLKGHIQPVTNAVFSPDGKWVATVSQDQTAQLWDAKVIKAEIVKNTLGPATNRDESARNMSAVAESLAVFRGHIKPLTSVGFSPNSKFLVTASEDRTARVWDLRSLGAFNVLGAQLAATPDVYRGKCPANVRFLGEISVAGRSGDILYKFVRSDGTESLPQRLSFDGPGSKQVSETRELFSTGAGSNGLPLPINGWVKIVILEPTAKQSNEATFTVNCNGDGTAQLQLRDLTAADLQQIMPGAGLAQIALYLPHLQKAMDEFGINTPLRRAAFLAEVAQNTAQLSQLSELGTDETLEQLYGSRKDLGNYEPNDGSRYKGRGAFLITGRANYQSIGAQLGVDLIAHPEKAAAPEVAFRSAALVWQKNGLNERADASQLSAIHQRVYGGQRRLAEVQAFYDRAKRAFGVQ